MEIPRALLDEYTAQLNALSEAGKQLVINALQNAEWKTIAELRNIMVAVMNDVCSVVADDAAVVASDMYDDIREMSVGKRLGKVAPSSFDGAATSGAVRALIQSVVDTGKTDAFGRELAGRVDYEVKRSAGDAPYRLGANDPAKPKFARVPSGFETCPFCLMLASFGAHYNAENSISHVHANCDCRMVQVYDGMSFEGYDPDKAYPQTESCLESLGGRDGVREDWNALPESERIAAINKRGGSESKAFEAYVNKRLAAEMATRDIEWIKTGTPCSVSKEKGAKPLHKERELAVALSKQGISVEFIKEVNAHKVKTPDARLNDNEWEFKIPEEYNEKTVKNQFKKALGKGTDSMVISCHRNNAPVQDVLEDVRAIFDRQEFSEISQVLVLGADGSLRRIRRK